MEYVEACLSQWAEWNRDGRINLGYPRRTLIHRMMKEGAGAGHAAVAPAEEMPEAVFRVEQAIRALPDLERQAIKLKYLHIYLTDNMRAKKLHKSRAQFFIILDRARWFIRGRIG